MTNDQGYVFISYKSQEIDKAREIKQFLEKEGYKCWMAPDSLHKRGTQDYGNDIFEAIRNSSCVLFALSNFALCSDWVRKEVKYALEKCHKPIVPFVVDTIPSVKYDSDELMISLSLQKQILNEDLSNNFSTILPYVRQCIRKETDSDQKDDQEVTVPKHSMTKDEYKLILSQVAFYEKQIGELSKIDYLEIGGENRPFEVYHQELITAVRIAACGLIRAFRAIAEGVIESNETEIDGILARLYKLTYYFGSYYNQDVFSLVEPIAKTGAPWACFVLHVKYYSPEAGASENVHQLAFQLLSNAVKDTDNPYAAILMGTCYQWGIGCEVSGTKAHFWYELALGEDEEGNNAKCPAAYSYLGRLYSYGLFGIEPKKKIAENYFKKGVAAHDACTSWRYGRFFWDNGNQTEALYQYITAYEGGEIRALPEIIILLKWGYECDLSNNCKYTDQDRLLKLAEKANVARLKWYECDPWWSSIFGEKDDDVIISYSTDGITQKNSNCAEVLADVLVKIVHKESQVSSEKTKDEKTDTNYASIYKELDIFIRDLISYDKDYCSQYIRASLDYAKDVDFQNANKEITLAGYQEMKPCASVFWRKLIISDISDGPSALEKYNLFTPFKFLEAVKEYPVHNDSSLKRLIDIWGLLRDLDYEKYDAEQIEKGHFSCLSKNGNVFGVERYALLIDKIEKLGELVPELQKEWLIKVTEMKEELKLQLQTMSISKVNEKILTHIRNLDKSISNIANNLQELRLAKHLSIIEHSLSHPALSVALNYYRLAYLWGGAPGYTHKMTSLFLVNNARLQDINKNEGLIYYISSEIEKCVYQMYLSVIPLFIEISLFGLASGKSRVEPNFEAIYNADPTIMATVQQSINATSDYYAIDNNFICLEIALAMVKIYSDKHLCNTSRCEQQWGVSSLYNPVKTLKWINQALAILEKIQTYSDDDVKDLTNFEKEIFKKRCAIENQLDKMATELSEMGLSGVCDHLEKAESSSAAFENKFDKETVKYAPVEVDQKWKDILKNAADKLDLATYDNLAIGDGMIDYAIATDDLAMMLFLIPGDRDFDVLPKMGFEWHRGVPEVINGVISLDFVDLLESGRAEITKEMDGDEKVFIGIVASKETALKIKGIQESQNPNSDFLCFDYDNLEQQLKEIFLKDDKTETEA